MKIRLDVITVILTAIVINISIITCNNQNKSNDIAEEAYNFAKNNAKKSSSFDIINAETQWPILRDSFDQIDNEIADWEQKQNYTRNGKSADSVQDLDTQLEGLDVPDQIRKLYRNRYYKYGSLKKVADQYKPFEEELSFIDFALPAPVLPKPRSTVSESPSFRSQ